MSLSIETSFSSAIQDPAMDASMRHVQQYPLVTDTVACLAAPLQWAKRKSPLLDYSSSLVASNITRVCSPWLSTFHAQLDQLDKAVNEQLYRLDRSYPILQEPTAELFNHSVLFCQSKVEPLRKKCHAITSDKRKVLEECARKAIHQTDAFIDRYLPSDSEESSEGKCAKKLSESSSASDSDVSCSSGDLPQQVFGVFHKTGRRIHVKSMRRMGHLRQKVHSAVQSALESVWLLERVQAAKQGAVALNAEFWQRFHALSECQDNQRTSEQSSSSSSSSQSLPSVTSLDQRLLKCLAHFANTASKALTVLTDMIFERLDVTHQRQWKSTQAEVKRIYHNFKQISSYSCTVTVPYLDKLREVFRSVAMCVEQAVRGVFADATQHAENSPHTSQPIQLEDIPQPQLA